MELLIKKSNVHNSIYFSLLVILSFIPSIGITFSTLGFTWTPYRVFIALTIFGIVALRKFLVVNRRTNSILNWIIFLAFWIVYGIVLLFFGEYTSFHNGIVELLSVFNGFIIMLVLSMFLTDNYNQEFVKTTIFWLLNVLLVFGIFEILTGWHWITSSFKDAKRIENQIISHHYATGFMYNVNDFSTMITCMTPILIEKRFGRKRLLTIAGVLFINVVNDATTCTLAIVLFIVYYYLIIYGGKTRKGYGIRLLLWGLSIIVLLFFIAFGERFVSSRGFIGALARQVFNARRSVGSLHVRLLMYKDTIHAWLSTSIFGMGPGSFSNYFIMHKSSSGLINPHSLFFEVLSQYGIIVIIWFIWLLTKMYLQARKMCNSLNDGTYRNGLMIVAFVIIYCVSSFAPSSFLGYAYQWMLIAFMCSYLDIKSNKNNYFTTWRNQLCLILR